MTVKRHADARSRFPRRSVMLILVAILLLTLMLRYPLIEHERNQSDSFFIHRLAQSIADNDRARWTFNPLSYFGYFALSYPSGAPFLVAELSDLTGVNIEGAILLAGLAFGLLFALTTFCLARILVNRIEFVLIAMALASLGPRFLDTTYWVGSARGPVIVMMVLTLLVLFRNSPNSRWQWYIIGILFGLISLTMHHMAVMFVPLGVGYVAYVVAFRSLLPRLSATHRRAPAVYAILMASVVTASAIVLLDFFTTSLQTSFGSEDNLFYFRPESLSIILNMVISYSSQIGLALPIALFGVAFVFWKLRPSNAMLFMVAILIPMVPLLGKSLYLSMVLLPLMSILAGMVMSRIFCSSRATRRGYFAVGMIIIVVLSVMLSSWSVNRWNEDEYFSGDSRLVGNQVFNDAQYLRTTLGSSSALCNVQTKEAELVAISGVAFLRPGVYLAINGEVVKEDLDGYVDFSGGNFPYNIYSWFQYSEDGKINSAIEMLMTRGVESIFSGGILPTVPGDYFADHTHLIVVVDNNWPGSYVTNYGALSSVFLTEIGDACWEQASAEGTISHPLPSYCLYRSQGTTVFVIQLPRS